MVELVWGQYSTMREAKEARDVIVLWLKNDVGMAQWILAVLVDEWAERSVFIVINFFTLFHMMIELHCIGSTTTKCITRCYDIQLVHKCLS